MITVEPTTNELYIQSVFLNPSIYADMRDDSAPTDPTELISLMPSMTSIPGFFLRAFVDGIPAGCWWLIWKGDKVEAHTALMANCRGKRAIQATRMAIQWVFDNTKASAITSYAWSDSPAVAWFCRAVGMSQRETKPWPTTRSGKPVDITYFEIGRTIQCLPSQL